MITWKQKKLEIKRNHHHVWADYLRRWSQDGKKVYLTTKKSKSVILDDIKSHLVEKDFYKTSLISHSNFNVLKLLIDENHDKRMRDILMDLLHTYLYIQNAKSVYQSHGVKNPEMDNHFLAWEHNSMEDYHANVEKNVKPILAALANRDFDVLKNQVNMIAFMHFFGMQITRTKNFKEGIFQVLTKAGNAPEIASTYTSCWWFVQYIFGMNISASLFSSKNIDAHTLLINDTSTTFITSDQPIINVHPSITDEIRTPAHDECDFYYPISPTVAYMISNSHQFPSGVAHVTIEDAEKLNVKIAKKANIYIVSNTDATLHKYKKYVSNNFEAVKIYASKL